MRRAGIRLASKEFMQLFEEVLFSTITAAQISPRLLGEGECQSPTGQRCRLCHAVNLEYDAEAVLKNEALQKFWKTLRVSCRLDPLIRSPLGREYRTTTKRRMFSFRDSVRLGLISPNEAGELKPFPVMRCAIEPSAHSTIYKHIQESISKPYAKKLAKVLNHVVIKGNYSEQTVIFNVNDISPEAVHAANTLSKSLTKKSGSITGVFMYEDTTSPGYYLGSRSPDSRPRFKKLFGKPEIFHRTMGRSFLFSPLSFSQINQAILEKMVHTADQLLQPAKESTLFDLYCGYGLFGLCLAGSVDSVIAVEVSALSVESAIANAKRQKVPNVRFIRSDINDESLERIMSSIRKHDIVLLDPPRKGTSAGVIEGIAAKQPRRVLHIFCEIDLIATELKRWERHGYKPARAVPFDMFPGTATMETMVLLEPR
ncbi:MAG: class I SAM-dependent RNA methyltransferase [Bacteroidetes bacterium]|nr:class I SAM-dependent RNA methyltransferase [Bacteroidota bacterium]MCW5895669.1 class I SAM-dependent RNA methyltransferase [Bacteroidota bacterium]